MTDRPTGGLGTMLAHVAAFPRQLRDAADLPGLADLQPLDPRPRQVLLCGMGGSAIAGDLLQRLTAADGVQLTVWRDYGLPGWVDANTLVVGASYSGNTAETLSAVAAAGERSCPLLAITSGGRLLAECRASEPAAPAVIMPAGLPPRAALGHSLGALLHVLSGLGLAPEGRAQLPAALEQLLTDRPLLEEGWHQGPGPAAQAARVLAGRFVVIYSSGAESHAAGARLKAQLNENAKCPAYHVGFPELDHNDIVGWRLAKAQRDRFALLVLRGAQETEWERQRCDATLGLLAEDLPVRYEYRGQGANHLARVLSQVQFGDYVSCYVAAHHEVDPVPVARIERLKELLAEGRRP